jgi:putative ABC transport system permease protein
MSLRFDVSDNFFGTMGIKLVAGRGFDRRRGEDQAPPPDGRWDPARQVSVVVDEEFVRLMGLGRPGDAIGRLFYSQGAEAGPTRTFRVIGVAQTKPLSLMALGISSQVYLMTPSASHAVIRVSQQDVAGARNAIKASWDRLVPNVPLKLRSLNERFDAARNTNLIETIFKVLVVCSFAVASMGLFAMAIHSTRRRLHEIGVRKTLGATSASMVWMLLRDFSIPVVVANLLAWPLAFMAMRIYLNLYVHRVELTVAPFLLALVLTVVISWMAISWQAFRAARVDPAKVLRYE